MSKSWVSSISYNQQIIGDLIKSDQVIIILTI